MFVRKSPEDFSGFFTSAQEGFRKQFKIVFLLKSFQNRGLKSKSIKQSLDALSNGTRCVLSDDKNLESIGVIRDSPLPLRPVYEIVPNCPQIDDHPRFPEPLSITTRGPRGYRSASPPRDVERVRVHQAHTPQ